MIFVGIDIGSTSTETVVIDNKKNILTEVILQTGTDIKKIAEKSLQTALKKINLSQKDISCIVSTGYGRKIVPFRTYEVSEVSCHAKGAHFLFPNTRSIIDIGGQDSKAIRVNEKGETVDFSMNDKCAAGTGRFLEKMAKVLDVSVEELGKIASKSKKELVISSMCAVFAESEVVSLLAENQKREDISRALHNAIVDRVLSLAYKIGIMGDVALTGGVVKNIGVVTSLRAKLPKLKVNIPKEPQIVGALGAAMFALDNMKEKKRV